MKSIGFLLPRLVLACSAPALLSACTQGVPAAIETAPVIAPATAAAAQPRITVHRDAHCGCCHAWIDHLRAQGFEVEDRVTDDMAGVKQRLGIGAEHASCHTAEIAGYVVEGHVPAQDIRRLLRERPAIRGLALPGMPIGSPGMEMEHRDAEAYTVLALDVRGRASPYSEHRP